MSPGRFLRRLLGMETARDRRATVDPATGLPTRAAGRAARRTVLARALLVGCALVPGTLLVAGSALWWTRAYAWRRTVQERMARLSAHENHAEVLKFLFGDPTSIFYHDDALGFSGGPPPLSPEAVARLPEKRRVIQNIHDYWQTKYSDAIYREVFKANLPNVLFERYLAALWSGAPLALPDKWVREMPPDDLWDISLQIEKRWLERGR